MKMILPDIASRLKSSIRCIGITAVIASWVPCTAYGLNPTAAINIDVQANRHPISPLIYGVAHADAATLSDLNVPLNRRGGNPTSRYNWQLNADNRAQDWFFESLPFPSAMPGAEVNAFIAATKSANAQPMLTIPMIEWLANLGPNRSRLSSFSIQKYGPQQAVDSEWFPDAGNGKRPDGSLITNNIATDASVRRDAAFQQSWVQFLTNRFGRAATGGVGYYLLDNEHSLWHSTHRDVRPIAPTMDEIRDKMIDYATRIKSVDPTAKVIGPEEWGWSGYLFSGYDQQVGSQNQWSRFPDREAHAGALYLPWLLGQMRLAEGVAQKRLLDIFSVHFYPQGGEFNETWTDVSESMQLRRNRSTRALWDPEYLDTTWIDDRVQLIPRLKRWVNDHYPGTMVALTEYNWGAAEHINGATAQADILGIFGREGLDMANYWTYPAPTSPAYKAFQMYRNYDGNKSTFGDISVQASVENPDNVAAFAAQRGISGALTIMLVNKYLSDDTPLHLNIANFAHGAVAQRWQLTATNAIARQPDLPVTNGAIDATLPPQSITLLVVPSLNTAPMLMRVVSRKAH